MRFSGKSIGLLAVGGPLWTALPVRLPPRRVPPVTRPQSPRAPATPPGPSQAPPAQAAKPSSVGASTGTEQRQGSSSSQHPPP
ncbi:hypothetical protein VTJ83DRAFT_4731 [Remersonia thermophila]|uniref:Uncharacterized protein n=1 Tax=Remersonia thermophila TaxID=72144 RepID=A0ABR4DBQ3_9PEZI